MLFLNSALDTTVLIIAILGAICLLFLIFFIIYLIIASRKASIVLKKTDYLIEDITYKSEMLNGSVELIAKASDYLNAKDTIFKGNLKTFFKLILGNKNYFYEIYNKVKLFFQIEEESNTNTKNKKSKKPITKTKAKAKKTATKSQKTAKIKSTLSEEEIKSSRH